MQCQRAILEQAQCNSAANYVCAMAEKYAVNGNSAHIAGAFAGLLAMADNELAWETIRTLEAILDERSEQTQP